MVLNIVYCTDDNFAYVCLTSIVSVIRNRENEILHFYVIDNGISDRSRMMIENTVREYVEVELNFIPFIDFEYLISTNLVVASDRYSLSTFCRLFIEKLLPKDIERIIYMDCDTIICRSLQKLYEFDLKGKIIGGVDDCKSDKYRWVLGLDKNAKYINAGVLLIDLKKWREEKCEEKIVQYIEVHNGHVHMADQGAINAVLNENIELLPLEYNVMTHNFDFTYRELLQFRQPVYNYKESDIEMVKNKPIVIHYTGSFMTKGRGWHANSNHKKKELFQEYMKSAGTYEYCKDYKLGEKEKLKCLLEKTVSRKVMLLIATIVHEYVEPIKYYLIMRKEKNGSYIKKKNVKG